MKICLLILWKLVFEQKRNQKLEERRELVFFDLSGETRQEQLFEKDISLKIAPL
jgi:hypothetical protein